MLFMARFHTCNVKLSLLARDSRPQKEEEKKYWNRRKLNKRVSERKHEFPKFGKENTSICSFHYFPYISQLGESLRGSGRI